MTDDARALELYQLAQSVAEAKGRLVTVGLMTYREHRQEALSICYFPSTGHLEVWHNRKVLNVNREHGGLKVRSTYPANGKRCLRKRRASAGIYLLKTHFAINGTRRGSKRPSKREDA